MAVSVQRKVDKFTDLKNNFYRTIIIFGLERVSFIVFSELNRYLRGITPGNQRKSLRGKKRNGKFSKSHI